VGFGSPFFWINGAMAIALSAQVSAWMTKDYTDMLRQETISLGHG
jgi:hypothetical protein